MGATLQIFRLDGGFGCLGMRLGVGGRSLTKGVELRAWNPRGIKLECFAVAPEL